MTDDARDPAVPDPPRRPGDSRVVQPTSAKTVFAGIGLTLGLHGAFGMGMGVLSGMASAVGGDVAGFGLGTVFFLGVTQLVYMLPAWILCRRRGWHGVAVGLVIGAAVTFLLNSACFGIVMLSLGNMH